MLLAGISAFIALKGNTWNKDAKGFLKLTVTGRWALLMIIFTMTYSLTSVYYQREKISTTKQDKDRISMIIDY